MTIPVSVVIPCYRCKDTLHQVVRSVLDQTLSPSEIILVDDASGDGTKELLDEIAKAEYPKITTLALEENSGPGAARNLGWDAASQPWIAFLDADDVWHPRKLEMQWAWLNAHPDVFLCGHKSELFDEERCEITEPLKAEKLTAKRMLISNRLPTRSVMLRRDIPFRFQGKTVTEDYLLWLQVVIAGYPSYLLDACLAFSLRPEFSPGGYSGQLWKHEKRELNALRELRKDSYLDQFNFGIWTFWSFLKYLRREIRMRFRHA